MNSIERLPKPLFLLDLHIYKGFYRLSLYNEHVAKNVPTEHFSYLPEKFSFDNLYQLSYIYKTDTQAHRTQARNRTHKGNKNEPHTETRAKGRTRESGSDRATSKSTDNHGHKSIAHV